MKILIANRGEIAVRIIRACRELVIPTVAIFAKGEENSLHVQLADEAICVGDKLAKDSYLNMTNIISAAIASQATAIHPGFGFLSENAEFASRVTECGLIFIGPQAQMIEQLGDKAQARKIAEQCHIPIVPGSSEQFSDDQQLLNKANEIGYPLLLKAVSGGGGKGMRIVYDDEQLLANYALASQEALANFGDARLYLEKFIVDPHHIEVQIIADQHGNIVHLGERECSLQRNYQKMIEECPSPFISDKLRKKLGDAAIKLAHYCQYDSVGTVEFLVDKDQNFYFIEMNTRIQVEHPVTEMVTGIDIIKEMILVAHKQPLSFHQDQVTLQGHAIECRINAENPNQNFAPCPGLIEQLIIPGGPGIRIDSAVYQGYKISPLYDAMIAKVITYGKTREEARIKMARALEELLIMPIMTNIDFQYDLIHHPTFKQGHYTTNFINTFIKERSEVE